MSDTEKAGSAQRGNGYDPEAVKAFVQRIENTQATIRNIMDDAKTTCMPHREDLKAIKGEATDAGIPRRALNEVLRQRRLRREFEAVRDGLSADDQNRFDNIKLAL